MHHKFLIATFALLLLLCPLVTHANSSEARAELLAQFGEAVYQTPTIHRIPDRDVGPVQAIYYDALDYAGKPTRVFAYLAIPEVADGKKLPGMVLAHGGGGTAFHTWVKIWYDQGYASISMDLTGHMPEGDSMKRGSAHEFSGPHHTGMFDDQDKPRNEQWMYHAVADIMIANSLLRGQETVDETRIGLTGISWGGVISSLTAGVDDRFVFSAPVYGCGYLYDSKGYFNRMGAGDDDAILEKRKYWDPARFFTDAPMPMLWVNGDNDPHFSVDTMTRSHLSAGPESTLSIHTKMPHSHSPGWVRESVPEIYVLADHLLKGQGPGLTRITQQPQPGEGRTVTLTYATEAPLTEATLYYLDAPLNYVENPKTKRLDLETQFAGTPATINAESKTVTATLPEGCTYYYINLIDDRNAIVSSNLLRVDGEKL